MCETAPLLTEFFLRSDYVYGWVSWKAHDGFPKAQSAMNIAETFLNFLYLYLVHLDGSLEALSLAPVIGLITVVMTCSKTVLYVFNVSASFGARRCAFVSDY